VAGLKIVGIDASLTSTGVAVLNDSLHTEVIKSKKTGPERLIEIRARIWEIVFGAELVVIEGYAFAKGNQAHQMGELGGLLRVMFHEMRLNWIEVAPGQVKKFATGKGNADKRDMAVGVYKRWGREFTTGDEMDAFVLALIGQAYHQGLVDGLTAFQREVIDGIRNGKASRKKAARKAG
jgi:crossover junction endodeoxyribonuclease RuvC